MSEATTETKPAVSATTPEPVTGQPGETKPAATAPAAVTETTQTPKPQEDSKPKNAADFFRQREEKREKKAQDRVAELEKIVTELQAKVVSEPKREPEPPSLLDDPENWAKNVAKEAEAKALAALEARQKQSQDDADFEKSAVSATDWLRTRSHISEDAALAKEVLETVRAKYAHIGATDPQAATRLAYLDVCGAKGIVPDMDGFKPGGFQAQGGASSAGVRPSAPAGAKRVFQKGEVEKYIFDGIPGTPEFTRRLAEIEEAGKEGRVK